MATPMTQPTNEPEERNESLLREYYRLAPETLRKGYLNQRIVQEVMHRCAANGLSYRMMLEKLCEALVLANQQLLDSMIAKASNEPLTFIKP